MLPEQAAYDVEHYDLAIQVMPESKTIAATLTLRARVLAPLDELVLDLDSTLKVARIAEVGHGPLERYSHADGLLRIDLNRRRAPGEILEVAVGYGGTPREAPRPPWEGGFTWSETRSGEPWIATSCQTEGADIWWPCKDHPGDEPDSFDLHVTVPAGLVCASNGKLLRSESDDGRVTSHWSVSTPINNYAVALNIGPYVTIEEEYLCVTGETLPVTFWVLPESEEKARAALPEFLEHLRWYEKTFGPYPFRADKYGIAETPHLGMEHQTIIAYGHGFKGHKYGFDWLHHHELSHEWFGNLVTAPDWSDFWIHEGFGSYAQKIYIEEKNGSDAYHEYLRDVRGRILNQKPVAPRPNRSHAEMYFVDTDAAEGRRQSDGDMYFKGEWIIHTLRHLIGKDALFRSMRRLTYPDAEMEKVSDGSQCHFKTTDDFRAIAERESGMELGWFFELYLRQPHLPELVAERAGNTLRLRWKTPDDLPFPMPVEVLLGGERVRVEMPGGRAELEIDPDQEFVLDPSDWVLRKGNRLAEKRRRKAN